MTVELPSDLFDATAFAAGFDTDNPVAYCRAAVEAATAYQNERFREGEHARELIRQRSLFVDTLLGLLWDRHDWNGHRLALVAVGGYGRGELHPYSDVDLLVLTGELDDACRDQLSSFLTFLGDIRLNPGYSVRTIDECVDIAREDITVVTNLMETHVIRGDAAMMDEVKARTGPAEMWPSREFFDAKIAEQDGRHERFADTEYGLEPNVKSSPGGLRDLQVIGWIAERHFGVERIEDIDDEEFLSPDEREILILGREFMWHIRWTLHLITGREEDQLLFDHQREIAAMGGFEDGDTLAVEQFMQAYYRWALALGQLNDVLIQNFEQAFLRADREQDDIREVNARFQLRNGYIEARHSEVFNEHPPALFELFLICANDDGIAGIAAPTIRLLRDSRHLIDDAFRASEENRRNFIGILRSPIKMARQLRRMNRFGLLGAYLPEFGDIVGQMQHDMFHTYTVDAHTLEVVKNTRRFLYSDFEERFPVSSRVARRLRDISLLHIGALYHDIGKGRGGDHSELGAVDAEKFCREHGLDEHDTELVVWLVRNHLLMSAVSQRKDISDPDVIQQFAEHMGDEEHLDYLFTLTVADINGTNPTLWNAWRGSLLRQLYTETRRALRRGLDNPLDKQVLVEKTRQAAIDLLEARGFTDDELDDIWRERGEDYFLRERPEDIAWHTEAIASHHDKDTALVLVRNSIESSVANTTQIFIHTRSRAQLFSRICACLEQLQLSVHDARIYSGNDDMILDTFFVLDSDGQPIADDSERLTQIRGLLTDKLQLDAPFPEVGARRTPRQLRAFAMPAETSMYVDEVKNYSVLEVSAADRPGLLARLGRVFVAFNIELQAAKIQTLGERVEDVFFITDQYGEPITDPELRERIQSAIRDELDEQAAA